MKKLIMGTAVAALLAAPAVAQAHWAPYGADNAIHLPPTENTIAGDNSMSSYGHVRSGASAYAYVPPAAPRAVTFSQRRY